MQLVLYQPEIAGNVGAVIRLAACFATPLHVIGPCGFPTSDKKLKRASLDYGEGAQVHYHADIGSFEALRRKQGGRLVLLSTKADAPLYDAKLAASDWLLFGSESAGVPAEIAQIADLALRIPLYGSNRSLNLGMSAAICLAEALRQTGGFNGEHWK